MLTIEDIERFAPRPVAGDRLDNWQAYADALVDHGGALCAEFGIDTALELQHFIAQIAHESGGFTIMWESGAYTVDGLFNIFGVGKHSAKITRDEAKRLCALRGEARAKAIFERVYGLGNPRKARELGNTQPGDGYAFRGFGPMQITGRDAHEKYLLGDSSPRGALRAAFAEWHEKNCNEYAARDDIKTITKKINGGYNGFESRKAYLVKAKRVWPTFPGSKPPTVTPAAITAVSSKAKAAQAMVTGAKVTVAGAAVVEVADPLAKATEQVSAVNTLTGALSTFAGFVKAHAMLAVIVVAMVGWYFGRHIIAKIIEDFRSGRYRPSQGEPEQEVQP